MPYFKDKNILFIHIPKNAGMFIENILGLPKEIISYRQPTVSKLSFNNMRSILRALKRKLSSTDLIRSIKKEYLYGNYAGEFFFQHASLQEIIDYQLLTTEELDRSIKVAVHRNPLDRVISIYKYWGYDNKISFEEFCVKYVDSSRRRVDNFGLLMHLKSQYSYLKNDRYNISEIELLRFDSLTEDLNRFNDKYKTKLCISSEKINSSKGGGCTVSDLAKEIIKTTYSKDFYLFGYQ